MYNKNDHTFAICAYKESKYLKDCINSLLNQTMCSNIIISTSTPNDYIKSLATQYNIPLFINNGVKGIGGDWNFAYSCCKTPLVTIAHQDDIYEPSYLEEMLTNVNKSKNPIIYFCHYSELRNNQKIYKNKILNIKKFFLTPLKLKWTKNSIFVRRRILSLGNFICCPAVTYIKENVGENPFKFNFLCDLDWQQWEILSKKKGAFVYNSNPLMSHRIHLSSTTTEIIQNGQRTKEDYEMYLKFWPKFIAKFLNKFYSTSQNSNNVD